jgi:hypothetical protein
VIGKENQLSVAVLRQERHFGINALKPLNNFAAGLVLRNTALNHVN